MGDYPLFIARSTLIGGDSEGVQEGDRKAPWLLWRKRATGIGLETDDPLSKVRVSPSRATKGLSDRPLETFGCK